MQYRREIDGLRAVAVIPVILFHAGFPAAAGGFVGVDIFFVISGYLITSILIEDLAGGRFSLAKFYERRARRILPALIFVVLCCVPVAWMLMTPSQLKNFAQSLVAVSLFASNILFWLESGYFAPAAEQFPLLHTWSLAVEEQYYIFFPPMLYLAWRYMPGRGVWLIAALAAASLALSEWGWRYAETANFYLTPFRVWELFAGSLAAFVVRRKGVQTNEALSLVGLVAIATSIVLYGADTPFPSVYALLPVGGTVLLVLFCGVGTRTAALLGTPVLVGIGLISYSAYLWHQPLFAFARIAVPGHGPGAAVMLGLALLSLVLAAFSWRFIEQPFRGKAPLLPHRAGVFAASIAALIGVAAIGAAGHMKNGFPDRFELRADLDAPEFGMPTRAQSYCFYSFDLGEDLAVGPGGFGCMLGADGSSASSGRTILVHGDSFAAHWDPFWDGFGKATGTAVESVTTNWCFPSMADRMEGPLGHPAREQCQLNRARVRTALDQYDMAVLAGTWGAIQRDGFEEDVFAFLDHALETAEVPVVVMDVPAMLDPVSVERSRYIPDAPLVPDAALEGLSRTFWAALKARYGGEDRVIFLERDALFGTGEALLYTDETLPFTFDGGHISIYGAQQSLNRFQKTPAHTALLRVLAGG